jgi:hypothetical protein
MSRITPDFVRANNRREAVARMISKDPILRELYDEGPNRDGKGGWVNMIRDQHEKAYRLLFYLDRIRLAKAHADKEPYEVIYGEIDPNREEPNFPRALYTTSGAVNLMRGGLPGDPFVRLLKLDQFEIEPLSQKRDLVVSRLWDRGCVYVCIYDKEREALRILDLREYSEIYFVQQRKEIQVRNENDIIIGDMTDLRPFLLRLSTAAQEDEKESELERATREAEESLQRR